MKERVSIERTVNKKEVLWDPATPYWAYTLRKPQL